MAKAPGGGSDGGNGALTMAAPSTPEHLAAVYADGHATSFQQELLARILLEYAGESVRSVCRAGRLPWSEMDDAIQESVLRCLARMASFNPQKARLVTWCSAVSRRICIDMAKEVGKFKESAK